MISGTELSQFLRVFLPTPLSVQDVRNTQYEEKVGKSSETDSIKSQISSRSSRGEKGQHKKTPSRTSPATAR